MAQINEYRKKKQLLDQLSDELRQLEQDQSLKKELEFENKIRELMQQHKKSTEDFLEALIVIDPTLCVAKPMDSMPRPRSRRALTR